MGRDFRPSATPRRMDTFTCRLRWLPQITYKFLFIALPLFVSCSGSPTAPPFPPSGCVRTAVVYSGQSFYTDRPELETEFSGRLIKKCDPPTPNGRNHCFFLGDLPVSTGGRSDTLDEFVGSAITIRGKQVDIEYGPEIWPAAVCQRSN